MGSDVFEQAQFENDECSAMQKLRDNFLNSILRKFPALDLDEIYEILKEFKEPFYQMSLQMNGQNECSEPWTFDRLEVNNNLHNNDDYRMTVNDEIMEDT